MGAKLKLFQEQEKRLKIKSDLIQIAAKEQVYVESNALERGRTFELDFKLKELSPQINEQIKEHQGLNPVVSGWSPPSLGKSR